MSCLAVCECASLRACWLSVCARPHWSVLPCGIDIVMYLTYLALGIWPWLMVLEREGWGLCKKTLQLVFPKSAGADPNLYSCRDCAGILDLKSDRRSHKTKEETWWIWHLVILTPPPPVCLFWYVTLFLSSHSCTGWDSYLMIHEKWATAELTWEKNSTLFNNIIQSAFSLF